MFLSKNSITLLSSIGASSIPVVSVVALYKIKSFSQGNDVEAVSSNATVENVISDIQVVEPEIAKPEVKEEEEQNVEVNTDNNVSSTPSEPSPPQKEPSKNNEENTPSIKSETKATDQNIKITTDKKEEDTTTKTPEELEQIAQQLLKDMMEGKTEIDNSNIEEKISAFLTILNGKKSTITDEQEKGDITTVIQALTTLKEKISKNN